MGQGSGRNWTLLTNHGACLVALATKADATVREIANALEITERSAARILSDLRADGYLEVTRAGRRNRYSVNFAAPLRHPIGRGRRVRDLVGGVVETIPADPALPVSEPLANPA